MRLHDNGLRKLDQKWLEDNEPDKMGIEKEAGWLLMKRRTFNAEFKAKIVLEVLRGEKELNVIAAANEIAPNQICNWKAEFREAATTTM